MRTLLRLGFLALIGLGLASQAIRAGRSDDEIGAKELLLGRLDRLQFQATPMPGSNLLMARSAVCAEPLLTGLIAIDGANDETARQFSRPDIAVRYVYLGAVEENPSRAGLFVRWGWATVLFDVGLRQTKPSQHMAMVAFAKDCAALGAIDWAALSPWT